MHRALNISLKSCKPQVVPMAFYDSASAIRSLAADGPSETSRPNLRGGVANRLWLSRPYPMRSSTFEKCCR